MRVIISEHARKRLTDSRQQNIAVSDIVKGAQEIPGTVPIATRFRGFLAKSGRIFDLVAKDITKGRLIITVIGK